MLATLLETSTTAVPTIFAGLAAFGALMFALIWVTGMGSGRPNTK